MHAKPYNIFLSYLLLWSLLLQALKTEHFQKQIVTLSEKAPVIYYSSVHSLQCDKRVSAKSAIEVCKNQN